MTMNEPKDIKGSRRTLWSSCDLWICLFWPLVSVLSISLSVACPYLLDAWPLSAQRLLSRYSNGILSLDGMINEQGIEEARHILALFLVIGCRCCYSLWLIYGAWALQLQVASTIACAAQNSTFLEFELWYISKRDPRACSSDFTQCKFHIVSLHARSHSFLDHLGT